MGFQPKEPDYNYRIKTIESHTMGEPTRIIYDGFPTLSGATMMEKKHDLMAHWDHLRTALMQEPRGHRNMFGALLTEPVHPEADFGVIFLDCGGCLNMCGHGSIGVCSMAVDTGMVKVEEPFTHVTLDTPSGLIQAKVKVENGIAKEVTIENVPAFLYLENQSVTLNDGRTVPFDVSFGGSFFNASVSVSHPTLDIRSVDLVEFYSHHASDNADMRNCVVFGDAQVDRSPCGTGTSAKLAALVAKGELGLHETFRYESITGSLFRGEAVREAQVGPYQGVIPHITGSAYLTGFSQWLLRDDDPLNLGFLL